MSVEVTTSELTPDNATTNATNGTTATLEVNRTEFIVLTCIIAPLSFFGNLLIIICFIKEKKLR